VFRVLPGRASIVSADPPVTVFGATDVASPRQSNGWVTGMSDSKSQDPISTNIAIVQNVYSTFCRGEVDELLATVTPDVEWTEPDNPFNPAAGTRHGVSGVMTWLRIGRQSETILALEPRRFLADGDTVVVIGFMKCVARATGRCYESDFVHVIRMAGGKIARFQEFFDTYAAAEAFRP
jgi:ketosteroid isomerase-like protein